MAYSTQIWYGLEPILIVPVDMGCADIFIDVPELYLSNRRLACVFRIFDNYYLDSMAFVR